MVRKVDFRRYLQLLRKELEKWDAKIQDIEKWKEMRELFFEEIDKLVADPNVPKSNLEYVGEKIYIYLPEKLTMKESVKCLADNFYLATVEYEEMGKSAITRLATDVIDGF